MASIDVGLALISCKKVQHELLTFIVSFLGHKFPRIRRYTAEQFYARIVEEEDLYSQENYIQCTNILLQVKWEENHDGAQQAHSGREQIARLLSVQLPKSIQMNNSRDSSEFNTDEFSSYQSLVQDAGR